MMASSLPILFNIANHSEDQGPILSPLDLSAVQDVNTAAAAAIRARKTTIQLIRATAQEIDQIAKHKSNTAIAGKSLSIIGSVVGCVAGGIVIVATAGAAAVPIAAAVLLGTGAGVGVAGGLTHGVGGYICSKQQDTLLEKLRMAIEEDDTAHDRLQDLMNTFRQPKYDQIEFAVLKAGLTAAVSVASTIAYVKGGVALISLLSTGLPKIKQYIENKDIQKLLGSALVTVLVPLLIKSLEVTAKTGVSIADDIALGVVGTMVDGPTKKIAFETARNAAAAVIQGGGDDVASVALNVAARAAAKEAAQNVVKVMARVTGGVTIGLGFLVVAWDAHGLYKECNERKKESLGEALRRLAKSLEDVGSS